MVPVPNITVMMPAPLVKAAAILAGDPKNEYDFPGSGRPGSKRSQEICHGTYARVCAAADAGVIPHEIVPDPSVLKDTGNDVYGEFVVYEYQGPDAAESKDTEWPTGRTVGGRRDDVPRSYLKGDLR